MTVVALAQSAPHGVRATLVLLLGVGVFGALASGGCAIAFARPRRRRLFGTILVICVGSLIVAVISGS
jgi:hypothetical protein